ncbi:MAG: hypothetical protein CVT77_04515 [Alphaproteobacteria bacterium HGW-Alphaproteobacteria-16]|nr:MAG: hypothetical protein CVT77_04515 [Alphaproteobacteria bacterium HGW-Alphaproteobacteria-16]
MFSIWKPRQTSARSGYHASRSYEEQVRAELSSCEAARLAHLQLSDLHRAASAGEGVQRERGKMQPRILCLTDQRGLPS